MVDNIYKVDLAAKEYILVKGKWFPEFNQATTKRFAKLNSKYGPDNTAKVVYTYDPDDPETPWDTTDPFILAAQIEHQVVIKKHPVMKTAVVFDLKADFFECIDDDGSRPKARTSDFVIVFNNPRCERTTTFSTALRDMKDQGSPPGAKPPGAKRVTLVEPPTKPTGAGNAGAHRMPQANLTSDQSSSDGNVSAIKNARSQRIGEKEMLRRKVEQAEARSRRLEAENEHLKSLRKLQDEETQRAERKNFRFAAILKSFQEHFPDVEETVWNIFRDDMEAKDWEMLPMFHESALWRQNVQVEQEERNRRLSEWALRTYRNRFIHVAWRGWTTFLQDCHDTRLFERMKESFNFWLSLKRLGDRNREAKRIVSRLKMRNAYRQWNIVTLKRQERQSRCQMFQAKRGIRIMGAVISSWWNVCHNELLARTANLENALHELRLRQRRLVIQEWHVETVEVYQWRMANVKAMLMLKLGNCFDAWYCALEGLKHARINLERVQHRLRIRKLTSFFVAWANYIDEAMEEREMESAAAEARSETSDEEEANNNQDAAEGRLSWMDVGDEELLEAANAKAGDTGEPQTRPRTTSSIAERWRKKVESMKNGEVDDALNERLDMIRQLKQELSIDSLESDNVEESDAVGELPAPDSQAEQNTANDDSSPARPPSGRRKSRKPTTAPQQLEPAQPSGRRNRRNTAPQRSTTAKAQQKPGQAPQEPGQAPQEPGQAPLQVHHQHGIVISEEVIIKKWHNLQLSQILLRHVPFCPALPTLTPPCLAATC
ncbi:hypothetical protein CYMTET_13922 [Cymbomonas tetramitiformis]|uniref:Sfi1 spindle body domain-containing protein n=1 Tax=Cymbomonas tetramitiformis TaxID=36881 RepID=A0AAE0GHK7_9CHLO|nr:hypothetical protein CYMTET_13922 [Cymbomonas tetramitiformis]